MGVNWGMTANWVGTGSRVAEGDYRGGPSDWDLVDEARRVRARADGDGNAAFSLLFDRHGRRVYSFLARLTGDSNLAEDLTQETFLAAYRHLDRLRPERTAGGRAATLGPWLFRVARNLALSHFRRPWARERAGGVAEGADEGLPKGNGGSCGPGPEEVVLRREAFAEVRRAVAALSRPYQEVLALHYAGGLTQSEISMVLGLPRGTVATRMRRGLERLAAILSDHGRADP